MTRRRTLPMSEAREGAFTVASLARRWDCSEGVIRKCIERGAKRVSSVKKAFQAASERSGIHVTPYTLRHTGAVWAAEAGISMAALAQFLGHDTDTTTQVHYARFSPDYLASVADAVQRRLN